MKSIFPSLISVIFLCGVSVAVSLSAQNYEDYLGAGHEVGITVTTSSSVEAEGGQKTISGGGRFPDMYGASRFLGQATLGANWEQIEELTESGIDAWLDEQFEMPGWSYTEHHDFIFDTYLEEMAQNQSDTLPIWWEDFGAFAFYQKLITDNDLLKQRVALALTEILVVNSNAHYKPYNEAAYHDIMWRNAFGNFRDILQEISFNGQMAVFLSFFANRKTDLENNIRPDENYAREIMQLFTIGLFELNIDGSYKLDEFGALIPTYDNEDIVGLAKVFTGLYASDWDKRAYPHLDSEDFHLTTDFNSCNLSIPLTMHDDLHEPGQKTIIGDYTIPGGQTGVEDITEALDHLFAHPNVGPFISSRLIQFLVKSNPSPAYIKRVATVFNDNGKGVRGDMKATVRAILIDPEARDCSWLEDETVGKMKEPWLRIMQLWQAFDAHNNGNRYWHADYHDSFEIRQSYLGAPSVFNYFSPSYSPNGIIKENGLLAPEFQIVDAQSSISYINRLDHKLNYRLMDCRSQVFAGNEENPHAFFEQPEDDLTLLDLSDELTLLTEQGALALMERLNIILCHGQMNEETKIIIADAVDQYLANGLSHDYCLKKAIYFTMASPDFVIIK